MPTKVLIADGDQVTANWLRSILEREGYTVETVSDGGAALRHIDRELPDVVVLEAVLPDGDGLEIVRSLRKEPLYRDLHLIILSKGAAADVEKGIAAGADAYVIKRPGADTEVMSQLRVWQTQPMWNAPAAATNRHGRVFSFCSAKGGTGTTSICVNTAYALAKIEPFAEILVVDLVFPIGTIGQSLGYASPKTVVDLTHEHPIDPSIVEQYVSGRTKWGFRLLRGANDPQEAAKLEVNQLTPLFQILKSMYDYILVDFGRALSRISLPIMQTSRCVVLVLTPDISTVKVSKQVLQFFAAHDIPPDRVFAINNRTVGRVWTTGDGIERELSIKLNAMIPHLAEHMTLAINEAVPFMERFPDDTASVVFTDIARQLRARMPHRTG